MLEVYSVVLSVGTRVLEAAARPVVENTVEIGYAPSKMGLTSVARIGRLRQHGNGVAKSAERRMGVNKKSSQGANERCRSHVLVTSTRKRLPILP